MCNAQHDTDATLLSAVVIHGASGRAGVPILTQRNTELSKPRVLQLLGSGCGADNQCDVLPISHTLPADSGSANRCFKGSTSTSFGEAVSHLCVSKSKEKRVRLLPHLQPPLRFQANCCCLSAETWSSCLLSTKVST